MNGAGESSGQQTAGPSPLGAGPAAWSATEAGGESVARRKTFAELFCAREGVKRADYVSAVLRRTLYPQARPLAPLLSVLFRSYFEADHDFIEGVGRLSDPALLVGEASHFQRHALNRGFLRRVLRLRVSVLRMTRLVESIMERESAAERESRRPAPVEAAPAPEVAAMPAPAGPEADSGVDGAGSRPVSILCADDDVTLRTFYSMLFQRAGYPCVIAVDGQEAIEILSVDPARFDLVITDHDMPRMGGLEFVKRIRETTYPGKIMVVSGTVGLEGCLPYKPLGVNKIMFKPLLPDMVLDAVFKLTRKRPRRPNSAP